MSTLERDDEAASGLSPRDVLRQGIENGFFPGAQGCVIFGGAELFSGEAGTTSLTGGGVPVDGQTLFDLASLTKVLAATPAVLRLAALKEIRLDDPVRRFWPAFAACGKDALTLRMLLCHASGLPAWKPFFLDVFSSPLFAAALNRDAPPGERKLACQFGKAAVLSALERIRPERRPWEAAVYSDLGFITLGSVVERVTGMPFQNFVRDEVHRPLGLDSSLAFRPLDAPAEKTPASIAATGLFRPREPAAGQEKLLRMPSFEPPLPAPIFGEADDDNAFAMGGVSGHAGLFGTARDVALFGWRVLEELGGAGRLGPAELWQEFLRRDERTPDSTRALGFDTPSASGSSAGELMAASRSVGHTGFTGTSLWIDISRGISAALLTNRVHPRRGNEGIRRARPAFGDAAVRLAMSSGSTSPL